MHLLLSTSTIVVDKKMRAIDNAVGSTVAVVTPKHSE
jgi:hypothetical protein